MEIISYANPGWYFNFHERHPRQTECGRRFDQAPMPSGKGKNGMKMSMAGISAGSGTRGRAIRRGVLVMVAATFAVTSSVMLAGSAQADDPNNPGYHQLQVYVPSNALSFSVVSRTPSGQKGHISTCVDKGSAAGWRSVGLVKNRDTVESWGYSVECAKRTAQDQIYYKKVVPTADTLANYWLDLTK